jgi:putative membrane protein
LVVVAFCRKPGAAACVEPVILVSQDRNISPSKIGSMMNRMFAAAAGGALLLGSGGVALAQGNKVDKHDEAFLRQNARSGVYEKAISETARQNATNPEIKRFAEKVVAEHGRLNKEAEEVANSAGMTLPTTMTPEQQAALTQLKSQNGTSFDEAYLNDMINENRNNLATLEKERGSAQNQHLQSLVQREMLADRAHVARAKILETAMGGSGSNRSRPAATGRLD